MYLISRGDELEIALVVSVRYVVLNCAFLPVFVLSQPLTFRHYYSSPRFNVGYIFLTFLLISVDQTGTSKGMYDAAHCCCESAAVRTVSGPHIHCVCVCGFRR